MRNIVTNRTRYAPYFDHRYEWHATREGYNPGDQIGFGTTEQEAIDDLLAKEGEDGK